MDKEKLEKIKKETQFIHKKYVAHVADRVIQRVVDFINQTMYKAIGKTMSFSWADKPYFRAYAHRETPEHHHVVISYGFAIELYRDAFVLSKFAHLHFCEPKYEGIFGKSSADREGVLPPGVNEHQCKMLMFETTLEWVFFHELAHLAQGHLEIREQRAPTGHTDMVEEMLADGSEPLQGVAALISHVTEIAADVEGFTTYIQYRYLATSGKIPYAVVYMMVCGLTCLFNRFFGPSGDDFDPVPRGSHPNPALRWELLLPTIYGYFLDDRVKGRIPAWEYSREELIVQLTEASMLANMYWHIRYLEERGGLPNFMRAASMDSPAVRSYLREVVATLDEITPDIERRYIFPIRPSLPVFTPEWRERLSET
ncbi:hypothetical protein AB1286_19655 [Trinickia sp. NRRL B-1857]|uniref:hypothetical protein n=1 Tax=Trinickia sp. NRRL B-1857 TaxID=3162879 RepID=UPI003D2C5BD1